MGSNDGSGAIEKPPQIRPDPEQSNRKWSTRRERVKDASPPLSSVDRVLSPWWPSSSLAPLAPRVSSSRAPVAVS